jgi:hypothetical protein
LANLFTDVANPQGENAWADVRPPEEQVGASTLPDKVIDKTARLAAVANSDTSSPDLIERLDEDTKAIRDNIKQIGDYQVRQNAAYAVRDQQINSLVSLKRSEEAFNDPSLAAGIPGAVHAAMTEDMNTKARYALEQQAVDKITSLAASGDTTQARIAYDNLTKGDADQRLRDFNTKQLIIQREIDKAQLTEEQNGFFGHAVHTIVGLIDPVYNQTREIGNVPVEDVMKNWYDWVVHGGRLNNEASSLWNLPTADFEKTVREQVVPRALKHATTFGMFDSSEYLNILTSLNRAPDKNDVSAMDSLNVAGVVPFGKITKLGSLVSLGVRAGERRGIQEVLAKTALEMADSGAAKASEKTGLTEADVVDNLLPTSHSPNGGVSNVGLGVDANMSIERQQQLAAQLPEVLKSQRFMNEEEFKTAVDKTVSQIAESTGRELKDINIEHSETQLSGGSVVHQMELTIGKKNGGGYATEVGARKAANALGYDTAEAVQDQSGQWFFKVKKDLAESGFYTNLEKAPKEGLISRFLSGARNISSPFLADLAQQAGGTRNAVLKAVNTNYTDAAKLLKPNQKQDLAQILKQGENAEKWYNREEFNTLYEAGFKRQPTEAEWNMYKVHIDTNDMEWVIRNDDVYKQKLVKGFESIKFNNNVANVDADGLIDRVMNLPPKGRTYNAAEGFHYNTNKELTGAELARLKSRGFLVVTLEKPERLADGTLVKNFVVRPSEASITPLRRIQMGYRQGGHRMYEGKWFARQTVRGAQPDTGEHYLDNPNTYIVGHTRAEVQAWTNLMEEARVSYSKGGTAMDIDKIFEGSPGHPSGDEFVKGMESGLYEKETPFVTNYDRELPDEYNVTNSKLANMIGDPDENSYTGWMRTNGRMYYSGKGTQLKDWKGALAPTLSPYETINKALSNVANISSLSDYKITAVDRWMKTFENALTGDAVPAGSSNMAKFMEGKFSTKITDPRIVQAGKAQRAVIQRNIGWRSEWDREVEQKIIDFQQWVIGDNPNGIRHAIGVEAVKWWDNKNPLLAMRGLAFDLKLGLFNPAQIFLQSSTSVAALSLSPELGMKGLAGYYPLRAYLSRSGTEAMLTHLAPKFAKLSGMSEAEFKDYLRWSKKSGFFDFGGTHQLINSGGPNAVMGEMGDKVRQLRHAGRFLFNEGEMMNRGVASRIAWGETRKAFPELEIGSAEFNRKVSGRAEEYAFSMSKESSAAWQHGLASIPTQFWAYNARMLEAMLPEFMGGSKAFTGAQKARLVTGQFLLYGAYGVPLAPMLSGMLKKKDGSAPSLDSALGLADRGLLDEVIYHVTGADVAASQRIGTGSWISDTVRDLMGQSPYGEKSAADVLGGATFSVANASFSPVLKWLAYESGDKTHPITDQDFKTWISNVSSVNYALKAQMLAKYGILVSSKGTVILNDIPPQNAAAQLLGFGPGQQDMLTAMSAHSKDRKKDVDDAATVIRNMRTQMVNEPDRLDELGGGLNVFVRTLPESIREDALRKAHGSTDKSLYDALAHRIEKEKLQQKMINQMTEEQEQ